MPEDYRSHNLAYFLDLNSEHSAEIQNHHLLNCHLPAEDHEQLCREVGKASDCLEELELVEMLAMLEELSTCGQPMPPSEVILLLASYLERTSAISCAHRLNKQLPHLRRARYRDYLWVV